MPTHWRRESVHARAAMLSGETWRGRISPAAREPVRAWLERFAGQDAHFALEGTTGWRFVVEEIERAGQTAHLPDPAETAARRGASGGRRPTTATVSCSCGCCSAASC